MDPLNYDEVASEYDRRYALHSYSGIRGALLNLIDRTGKERAHVLEIGCGTGKWLSVLESAGCDVAGVDPSAEMLRIAEKSVGADLRQARAEELPWADETFDLIVCVNALHHFDAPTVALAEAHRVLRRGGAFLSIGLDPHVAPGRWYVYEYFPSTLAADLGRFPKRSRRIEWLREVGFERIGVEVVERIVSAATFDEALTRGILRRSFTSQLTALNDVEYSEGIERIRRAVEYDSFLQLRVDLQLHATEGWKVV